MASFSTSPSFASPYGVRSICHIVGLACLAGFVIDLIALGFPPDPFSLEWRIDFLQQVGDRSIILLFAAALLMLGSLDSRRGLRQLGLLCLLTGIVFHLSCILVIRDNVLLQQRTVRNISTQAAELQTQIKQAEANPGSAQITLDELKQAAQLVDQQASTLKQNTQTTIVKSSIASLGNLIVVGLGLIGLGRYGLRVRKG